MVPGVIASPWGPRRVRILLAVCGAIWLAALGLTALDKHVENVVPAVPRFLLQCSCLFPRAAQFSISYHLEAYSCDRERFVEFDHRVYFPLRPDDKESTFYRLGFFYHSNREVISALDHDLVEAHNLRTDDADGVSGPIGGIRLLSLRIPLPPTGATIEPYHLRPLSSYPTDYRQTWYITGIAARRTACAEAKR
jgi:hypothetical protein